MASGGVAVSYTMGKLDKLPLNRPLQVAGQRTEKLPVAGFGTVGIGGVDAVVSDTVARTLGIPAENAIVISAPHADLSTLMKQIKKCCHGARLIAPLVAQTAAGSTVAAAGSAGDGASWSSTAGGPGLSRAVLGGVPEGRREPAGPAVRVGR